ncbi:hypothetical protein [Naasia lichenicola]|uniref:Uncharacterized protein n=1 Tax=Naasia lichenicola TaxID=2565933 RepID=A0A4S4FJZ9_9MICO|nr:hypothetical protein [Naasia lichenicola]THG29595.1 hypothetical protein E6C64_13005 [Naasia lichenicola]
MAVPQRTERGVPRSVYRRRRILLLLGLLAAAVVVALIVVRPAPPPPAPPPPVAAPVVVPAPVSTVPVPCTADQVQITPTVDASEYAVGSLPRLSWSLVNVSAVHCLIDIGTRQQSLTVSDDAGVVWSTVGCLPAADQTYLLEPAASGAQPAMSSPTVWNRDSADGCTSNGDQLPSGTYQLSASVGGFSSATAASFVLD